MWDEDYFQPLLDDARRYGPTMVLERAMTGERDTMTPAEVQEFHRLRNAEQVRALMQIEAEKTLCKWLHVDWQADGTHWKDLGIIRDENEEIRRVSRERRSWWSVAVTAIISAIVTGGAGFLAGLFGAHKP